MNTCGIDGKGDFEVIKKEYPSVVIGVDMAAGPEFYIGAYTFPDRKLPCLCVQRGNEATVYGTFRNVEAADLFMLELAKLVRAAQEGGGNG